MIAMQADVIDRARPEKLYCQLLDVLKGHIENGDWGVGGRIPTEDRLCAQFQVSRATVRLAVSELVALGYIKRLQGKGTFVRRRIPARNILMLANLGGDGAAEDLPHIARILAERTIVPPEPVRSALNLAEDESSILVSRLIIAEGTPYLVQHIHLPSRLASGPARPFDRPEISVLGFVEDRCGLKVQRVREWADVYIPEAGDAAFLDLTPGRPVLRVRQAAWAPGETPLALGEFLYRTDRHPRDLDLERLRI